ncbi:MAG: DUF3105 domain-containing protein [Actinomycetota bacterium]
MPKKKTRKRRASGSGAEAQQRRRERLDARRQEKAAAEEARRRAAVRQKWIRRGLVAALGAALAWFFIVRQATPDAIAGHEVESFAQATPANPHTNDPVEYESRPPASGRHAPTWHDCGTYAEPVDPEMYVHSLEHGAVGILYKPDEIAPEDIEQIESIVQDYEENVLSSPYPDMDTAIAVTSWGEMIRLDAFEEDAIREYIDAFAGDGPEPGQTCEMGAE